MKVKQVFAALWLAGSCAVLALAQEPNQADPPVQAPQQAAPAASTETAAPAAASHPAAHEKKEKKASSHNRHKAGAHRSSGTSAAPAEPAPLSNAVSNPASAAPKAEQAEAEKAGDGKAPEIAAAEKAITEKALTEKALTEKTAENAATEKAATEKITENVALEKPAATPERTAEVKEPASWIAHFFYDIKATDVLLALFAGLLVLISCRQSRRLRETAAATRETALAAEKTARAAEEALIAGQRAFMFIKEFKTFLQFDETSNQYHWTIHPLWENSGNTPTRGLSINTTYRLLDAPLPNDYDFPSAQEDLIPTIAGPKAMVEAVPGSIGADALAAVQQGEKYFYVWGWAEYHDIFEGTKKHTTRFCTQLMQVIGDPRAPISEHNMVQMMFGFHSENNSAD